jgi:hypothetical protein
MAPDADLETEAGWVGKMRDSATRAAALLHVADGTAGDVTGDAMNRATQLGNYWIAHRLASIQTAVTHPEARRLLTTLANLTRRSDAGYVTRRELTQGGSKGLRTIDEVAPALEELETYGWIRLRVTTSIADMPFAARLRSCEGFEVHPDAGDETTQQQPTGPTQ